MRALGITTVGGEAEKRAALASALCYAAAGCGAGACRRFRFAARAERQPHAYQSAALTDQWPHQTFDKRNTALAFLRDTIRAHPSEITLLTIDR